MSVVKLLTEHDLEFLRLEEGCKGSSESTLVKMSHCWKSRVTAQIIVNFNAPCRKKWTFKCKQIRNDRQRRCYQVIQAEGVIDQRHVIIYQNRIFI